MQVFALLEKEDNHRIRARMFKTALLALQSLPPCAFFREASGLKDEVGSRPSPFHFFSRPFHSARVSPRDSRSA